MKNYKVGFNVKGLEGSKFNKTDELIEIMGSELLRVYDIYANKVNGGVTEKLNYEYDSFYMKYKEDRDMVDYNKYMAYGYQALVVNEMNEKNISNILEFYVEPTEVVLTGRLKNDRKITIDFYLMEV